MPLFPASKIFSNILDFAFSQAQGAGPIVCCSASQQHPRVFSSASFCLTQKDQTTGIALTAFFSCQTTAFLPAKEASHLVYISLLVYKLKKQKHIIVTCILVHKTLLSKIYSTFDKHIYSDWMTQCRFQTAVVLMV